MLAPVPLHEPAAVFDALAAHGAPHTLPSAGLAVLYDVTGDHVPGVVIIPDVPEDPPQHERARALGPLFRALATHRGASAAVLVVLREGVAAPRGEDYAWHDAYHGAAERAGVKPVGAYVMASGVLTPVRCGQQAVA